MAENKMPARIWATCNGMSTRLPDGHRQFIGGWSEDEDRPRAEQFIRADLVEPLVEALRECRTSICGYAITDSAQYPEVLFRINNELQRIDKRIRAALSSWEAGQ